jgi:hypothetical protein
MLMISSITILQGCGWDVFFDILFNFELELKAPVGSSSISVVKVMR